MDFTKLPSNLPQSLWKRSSMELPIKTDVRGQKFKNKKIIKFKTFELCPKSPSFYLLDG